MDNFIIVILGIVFFIGRIYMNYKKEQEEASKRNPSAPRQAVPKNTSAPSGSPEGIPKWLEELFPTEQKTVQPRPIQLEKTPESALPKEKHSNGGSIEYQRPKYIPTELPTNLLEEYRNLADKREIEELKRSVAIHRAHNHQFKRLDPFVIGEKEEQIDVPAFNLREAIIMKTILDRPYA